MKTYLNLKSGNRYPDHGCAAWFTTWSNNKGKLQHHIKPGYKECTHGWKTVKLKDWKEEEIPDLVKPFTREQWMKYANQYGIICAQEFLDTCDYMKPRTAYQMFHPPAREKEWAEHAAWFKAIFKGDLHSFMDGTMMAFGNTYSLDIVRFEKYLALEFGYPMHQDGSIKDFMIKTFGKETTEKFSSFAFPNC